MTKVLVYLKGKADPIQFKTSINPTSIRDEIMDKAKQSTFFSVLGNNGYVVLQSELIAGVFIENI